MERGNRYILVIVDYFTKLTECPSMPNMEANTVAAILIEQVVSRFGKLIPFILIRVDNFKVNYSQKYANYCKLRKPELPHTIQNLMVWWNDLIKHLQLCCVLL